MSRQIIGLLVVLSACAGGTEPGQTVPGTGITTSAGPQAEQRGSRLKRVWLKASDETVVQAGYYDSTLKTLCDFTNANGAASVCMPRDVYTLRADEWSSRYSTSSRGLYTDPKCGTPNVTRFSTYNNCTRYGVVRVMPEADARTYNSCGDAAPEPTFYVAKPVPAGTKIYEFGVHGGLCCSCQEINRTLDDDEVYVQFEALTPSNAAQTSLVSAQFTVDP